LVVEERREEERNASSEVVGFGSRGRPVKVRRLKVWVDLWRCCVNLVQSLSTLTLSSLGSSSGRRRDE
jgi:hypothetical protein